MPDNTHPTEPVTKSRQVSVSDGDAVITASDPVYDRAGASREGAVDPSRLDVSLAAGPGPDLVLARDPAAPAPTKDQVTERLEQAVLATDGVARLVPNLRQAVRSLRGPGPRETVLGQQRTGDGITLLVNDGDVTVTFDINVTGGASVLDTATAVRSAASALLRSIYPEESASHTVKVNVIGLEPDPTTL